MAAKVSTARAEAAARVLVSRGSSMGSDSRGSSRGSRARFTTLGCPRHRLGLEVEVVAVSVPARVVAAVEALAFLRSLLRHRLQRLVVAAAAVAAAAAAPPLAYHRRPSP